MSFGYDRTCLINSTGKADEKFIAIPQFLQCNYRMPRKELTI